MCTHLDDYLLRWSRLREHDRQLETRTLSSQEEAYERAPPATEWYGSCHFSTYFRGKQVKLIQHFDITFKNREIQWPSTQRQVPLPESYPSNMFVAPVYHNKKYSAFFLLSYLATTGVTVSRRQSELLVDELVLFYCLLSFYTIKNIFVSKNCSYALEFLHELAQPERREVGHPWKRSWLRRFSQNENETKST